MLHLHNSWYKYTIILLSNELIVKYFKNIELNYILNQNVGIQIIFLCWILYYISFFPVLGGCFSTPSTIGKFYNIHIGGCVFKLWLKFQEI